MKILLLKSRSTPPSLNLTREKNWLPLSDVAALVSSFSIPELQHRLPVGSATGKHCTNYREETEALKQTATLVKDSLEPCFPTVFLTDALSVLEALQTNKSPLLATQMQELGNTCRVVLQWIPAHCGIPGNEQADQLAKCGAQEEQPSTSIHYQEKTTIIKTALKPRQEKDAYHLLDRPGQVVLARLRSGHNRLNAHMHRKLKIVPSPTCPCGEED